MEPQPVIAGLSKKRKGAETPPPAAKLPEPLPPPDTLTTDLLQAEHILLVLQTQEIYDKQRLQALTPHGLVEYAKDKLAVLVASIKKRDKEREMLLLTRYGTVWRTLDQHQPVSGDLILCEKIGPEGPVRCQCVVENGVAWEARLLEKTSKAFCKVPDITQWRPAQVPVKPVETATFKSDVMAALEKGRMITGGSKSPNPQPR
jgi:hypothetical protein